ncbi:MAG: HAD hydrolase-like protein [bacterium]|nr:HAD hydrolase-like protein [bacterium]
MQNKIKGKKFLFFDIFDTILSRKIEPEYVKKIWCNYIIKTFDLNINMEDLYKKRNEIEFLLGETNHNNCYDYEFTYESLISKLYESIDIKNIKYKDFYRICEETEINIESNVLYPNKDMLDLIKKNYKTKTIICISDMYLSKKMIKEIFENLHISNYINDYYISCDYLKNKKSGSLYKIVIEKLNIKTNECIMIGDNINSDYNIPKSLGIESILLDRTEKYDYYKTYLNKKNNINMFKKINNISNYS